MEKLFDVESLFDFDGTNEIIIFCDETETNFYYKLVYDGNESELKPIKDYDRFIQKAYRNGFHF